MPEGKKQIDYAKFIQFAVTVVTLIVLLLNMFMGRRDAEHAALSKRVDKIETQYDKIHDKFDDIYKLLIELKNGGKK